MYVVVGLTAVAARLLPVLHSGGLYSVRMPDAAIYFGAAIALVHGELPYRDFLLLHPPGSTLALAPFAALGLLVGESHAWAVARVAVMTLGAVSAMLITRLLRPLGLLPAVVGGFLYAFFLPAIHSEITTRLEPFAQLCLLAALVIVSTPTPRTALLPRSAFVAGALLGFATTVKVWGVVPMLAIAIYLLVVAGAAHALRFSAGAALAGVVVCGPFFVAAPGAMWRQVVLNQAGRGGSPGPVLERLADMTGLTQVVQRLDPREGSLLVVVVVMGLVVAAVLAVQLKGARLAVVLLATCGALLLSTPTWFPQYSELWAGVLAITVGAAVARLLQLATRIRWRAVITATSAVVLLSAGAALTQVDLAERFPAQRMAAAVAPLPGCVTTDDVAVLIGMNVMGRNIARSCPLVIDIGGYTHDFRPRIVRHQDPRWQAFFLNHLRSGTVTMKISYVPGTGLTEATERAVRQWPVIYQVGQFELRSPHG